VNEKIQEMPHSEGVEVHWDHRTDKKTWRSRKAKKKVGNSLQGSLGMCGGKLKPQSQGKTGHPGKTDRPSLRISPHFPQTLNLHLV
jgi:hypothetical protein